MRIANLAGRATIVTDSGLIDIATASNGAFSASVDKCVAQLETLQTWYRSAQPAVTSETTASELYGDPRLGPVVVNPQQIFAVGLNYRHHANEMNMTIPSEPMVFTKFLSSLCGPNDELPVRGETTDFEAELVIVLGTRARDLTEDQALGAVAGYCVGQDFSERTLQRRGATPQYSLAKSFRNFTPVGPWLTTADEVPDPNDLNIACRVNDVQYQNSTTGDMIFRVSEIVSYLSTIVELRPGDLVFTGSPHGVGQGQTPPLFLKPGDQIVTTIERLGQIENIAV
ncbi:MAG TPA: fumarylacetoacetate hydrolase family protein [Acidimicrobiales bacterium]|jgi:2-keto-4-pentenoate hydratase/2-oxohepta-3-ene-1,7-dioic acid hydratase in catechol pathway|nr:fumarylacetoacetate hydrolase family protein [Acidimicrobiales bacterium]